MTSSPSETILDLLRDQAAVCADQPAFLLPEGGSCTYQELYQEVVTLAGVFLQNVSSETPYRIGVVMENGKQMSVALLAMTCVGAALPFDPSCTAAEFRNYFAHCELTHLLVDGVSDVAHLTAESLNVPVWSISEVKSFPYNPKLRVPSPDPDATAMVLLTSGSTGRPKRVPLTHRNVCFSARNVAESIALTPDDVCLSMWELFHIGGLVDLLLAPLVSGGKICPTKGFDAMECLRLCQEKPISWLQVVPTTLHALVQMQKRVEPIQHSLKCIRSVAAKLSVELKQEAENVFGVPVLQTYGMTEASPLIASTDFAPENNKEGSVGKVMGCEITILNKHLQKMYDAEPEGELIIRGPNVFPGYEGVSDEERESAFQDGWYKTGDIGRIEDDGTIYLLGRVKEVINRGGEKINMREVDDALLSHPDVREAACFAVKHPTLGEDIVAAVTTKGVAKPTEILEYTAKHIAKHKVPRELQILHTLPLTKIGKVDRFALTALYQNRAKSVKEVVSENSVSRKIAEIWKTEIGTDTINLTDNFLSLGGDSLSAVRMILAVENAFDIQLPTNVLSSLTNINALTAVVEHAESADPETSDVKTILSEPEYRKIELVMGMGEIPQLKESPLIKGTRTEATQVPLMWFFNYPGTEMQHMAKFLDPEIPFFGGYSGGRAIDGSDEKLWKVAQVYVHELLKVFPKGGIAIGGNCRGGRLAIKVTQLLLEKGIPVHCLCLLEQAQTVLHTFDIPILCMFGSASKHRAYEHVNWGRKGWQDAFAHPPTLAWTKGTHGGFFREDTICSITEKIGPFLRGKQLDEGTLTSYRARLLLRVHRAPTGFKAYRIFYKAKAYCRFGRRKNFNPFTGVVEK